MLKIAFLQDNRFHPPYTGAALFAGGVGGTESSVIQLAEALAHRGHEVYGLNRLDTASAMGGVTWMPLAMRERLPTLDLAVGINSARIFAGVNARLKVSWLHNPPNLKQQLKRRHLYALLKHRPHAVLVSRYQSALLNPWLPYSGRSIVLHGVGLEFFAHAPDKAPRPPRAIFASQPGRGLNYVAETFAKVAAQVPGAELHVFCPQSRHKEAARACAGVAGVVVRGSVSRACLAQELRLARVMLIPGVADETFCLAAAEATASGVPVVTFGRGALAERVRDGATGYIVSGADEFVSRTVSILGDEEVFKGLHRACLSDTAIAPWSARALEWEALAYGTHANDSSRTNFSLKRWVSGRTA